MKKFIFNIFGSAVMIEGIGCGGGGGSSDPAPQAPAKIEIPAPNAEIESETQPGTPGTDSEVLDMAPESDLATGGTVAGSWFKENQYVDATGTTLYTIRIGFVIRNLSEVAPEEGFNIRFWLSEDTEISENDHFLTNTFFEPNFWLTYQGPQTQYNGMKYTLFNRAFDFPHPGNVGGYHLLVRLDSGNDIEELSEENNDGVFQKTVPMQGQVVNTDVYVQVGGTILDPNWSVGTSFAEAQLTTSALLSNLANHGHVNLTDEMEQLYQAENLVELEVYVTTLNNDLIENEVVPWDTLNLMDQLQTTNELEQE